MLIFTVLLMVALLIIGSPIFVCMGLGAVLLCLFYVGYPLQSIALNFWNSIDSFVLLAVPFFILAGTLMLHGGPSKFLTEFFDSLVGHKHGGLAIVTIVACTFFAALSGSAVATAVAIGTIMIPAMVAGGYSKSYASGVVCTAATLGPIIPPSIHMILYGPLVDIDVGRLFIAGILPGLMISAIFCTVAIFTSRKQKYTLRRPASWPVRYKAGLKAIPALFMPLIILGGIYGGVFTPTEAAGVACIYGVFVGALVYRRLNWKSLRDSLVETARLSSVVFLIVAAAILLGNVLTFAGLPQTIMNWVVAAGLSKLGILVITNVIVLLLGCVMDGIPILYITVPLIAPAAFALGVDPYHFGIVIVVGLVIGQVTPPFGTCLFATSAIAKEPPQSVIRGAFPFLMSEVVALFIITFIPEISLFLPGLMGK